MNIKKLFAKATAGFMLAMGLTVSANASLIQQSFSFDNGATIEFGANTIYADQDQLPGAYVWFDDAFDFINIYDVDINGTEYNVSLTGDDFGDTVNAFELEANINSISGEPIDNGFEYAFVELDLSLFGLSGAVGFEMDFGDFEVEAVLLDGAGDIVDVVGDLLSGTPSDVKVNAPAAFGLMVLAFGGLILRRKA